MAEEEKERISMEKLEVIAEKIRKLELQAATPIAVQSLEGLRPLVEKKGFGKEFETACEMLIKTRPTGLAIHNALELLKQRRSIETLDALLEYFKKAEAKIVKIGSPLIPDKAKILTHCHSTTAIAAIKAAKQRIEKVFVTETRPVLQGIVTAKELTAAGIKVVYLTDAAVGWLFENHAIDLCVVGADAVKEDGVINKVGTHPIASVASEYDVPFYVATNTLKFDFLNKAVIEMRPAYEITRPEEVSGAEILNPAFDTTPWKNISGVVTEKGVLTRNEAARIIKQGLAEFKLRIE